MRARARCARRRAQLPGAHVSRVGAVASIAARTARCALHTSAPRSGTSACTPSARPCNLQVRTRHLGALVLLQVTQIYARGTLRTTRPINSKVLFDEFNAGLVDLVLEFADFSATVEGG